MNLSVDAACRNALHLVARRYKVTRQQIVEIAPLLFFLLAEQSLQERRRHLGNLLALADEVINATPSYLPLREPLDERASHYEHRSIDAHDLFGEKVGGRRDDPNWDEASGNPFALFLSEALGRVSASTEPVKWVPGFEPSYRICADQAEAIVGGDMAAAEAILSGTVALHDMPTEVRRASPAERAEWVKTEVKRIQDSIESIDADRMLVDLKDLAVDLPNNADDGVVP